MLLYKKLTLKGSVLRACGDTMWRGIYFSAPSAALVTNSDSAGRRTQIWDADNGAKLEYSNGTYQLEKTDFVNNRVGVFVNQVKPNSSSYIRGCNFYTATDTQPIKKVLAASVTSYDSLKRNKTLFGVQLNLADGVVVGSAVECQSTQNRFFNLHCGMYSFSSGFTALNNSFEGSTDTAVTTVNDWWRTGIFANGDIAPTRQQKIQIGDGSDCGMNRFYNGRFGVCLKNNNASDTLIINRNRFTHAYLADVNINSAQNAPRVEVMYNSMDSGELAGDGIRALGCVNSALYIHHNFIVNVPLTKVYTAASPYPKRSCGIVVAGRTNAVANRALKIYENYVTQAIYGIYSLNNKAIAIFNNEVHTRQVPYLRTNYTATDTFNRFSDNVGIMSTYDDSAVVVSNSIFADGVLGAFGLPNTLQNKVTGIAVNSNVKYTQVYCNSTNDAHWGILGLGTNTGGADLRNNRFGNHQAGIAIFGSNASIGNQGNANCPASTGSTGGCPQGTCPCAITAANHYTPDNRWVGCTYPVGVYLYDSVNKQQILMRNGGTLPSGWSATELNPALPTSCGNPNGVGSSMFQDFAQFTPNSRFIPRCVTMSNNFNSYQTADCSNTAGPTYEPVKFQMAQIDWWERVASGKDSLSDYLLAEDIHRWRANELLELLIQQPALRDSSVILDSFYLANMDNNDMIKLRAIYEAAQHNSDSSIISQLLAANSTIYPTNTHEANLQQLNILYINYFNSYLGINTMPASAKSQLLNIASQCYVTGGPSVFLARSMYWTATGNVEWKFQDDCLWNTGYFKNYPPEAVKLNNGTKPESLFKMYPTVLSIGERAGIEASQRGIIVFYDQLGQQLQTINFNAGKSTLDLKIYNGGVVFFRAQLENGLIFSGKIILKQ